MVVTWDGTNAAHLLRRAGFGVTLAETSKAVAKGQDATIASLLKPDKTSDVYPGKWNSAYLDDIQAWWLKRMATTKTPLTEKLTLFWHNHFATGFSKIEYARFCHVQNQAIRKHCLGKFRDLVTAVAKSAAMSIWLDNETNTAEDPNENFARELMELFTTGVYDKDGNPNYTEVDIQESARAFTGWSYEYPKGQFAFNESDHDFGSKTFKGHVGAFDGTDVIDILVLEPATARRVAWKLFNFFAYDVTLADPILDPLVQVYLDNDTAIQPVVDALFRMDEFYSDEAKHSRIKSPCEFYVGSLRMLLGKFSEKKKYLVYDIAGWIERTGQSLFDPPTVFGWKEGLNWVSSSGMYHRLNLAEAIADARKQDTPPFLWDPKPLLGPKQFWSEANAHAVVLMFQAHLGSVPFEPSTFAALEQYLQTDEDGNPAPFALNDATIGTKVRGLVALILSTPEYQLN